MNEGDHDTDQGKHRAKTENINIGQTVKVKTQTQTWKGDTVQAVKSLETNEMKMTAEKQFSRILIDLMILCNNHCDSIEAKLQKQRLHLILIYY